MKEIILTLELILPLQTRQIKGKEINDYILISKHVIDKYAKSIFKSQENRNLYRVFSSQNKILQINSYTIHLTRLN